MNTEERVHKLEARVRDLEGVYPKDDKQTITVPIKEYDELIEDQKFLDALRAAGVDNWEGYDIAQDIRDGKEW